MGCILVPVAVSTVLVFEVRWLAVCAAIAGVAGLGWFAGFLIGPRWSGRQVRTWQCLWPRTHQVHGDAALDLVPVKVLRFSGYCAAVNVRSADGARPLLLLSTVCSDPTKAARLRLAHQHWREQQVGGATSDQR